MKKETIKKLTEIGNSREFTLFKIMYFFYLLVCISHLINEKVLETDKNSELKFKMLGRLPFQTVNLEFPLQTIEIINEKYLEDYPLETGMCIDLEDLSVNKAMIWNQTENSIRFYCGDYTKLHTHPYNESYFCRPSPQDIESYDVGVTVCIACGNSSEVVDTLCWKKVI